MDGPRGRSLLVAAIAPWVLFLVVWIAPSSPLRVPLAVVALLWAPAYAGLAVLHPLGSPTLAPLERAALAAALGLAAAPVVGLAVSILWTLTPIHVAAAYVLLTTSLALLAWSRRGQLHRVALGDPSPTAMVPSTRATLAICAAAILVSLALFAVPLLAKPPASAALSILDQEGGVANLTRMVPRGAATSYLLEVDAGALAQEGRLVASITDHAGPGNGTVLLDHPMSLTQGQRATVALHVPALRDGSYELVVRWDAPNARTLHLWLDVGGP